MYLLSNKDGIMTEDSIEKISLTLPKAVLAGLNKEASDKGREVSEHIQKVLTRHVIDTGSIDAADSNRLRLMFSLVERVVHQAKTICRNEDFSEDITLRAINACLGERQWKDDYQAFVQDDIYKSGNPLKGRINREIGFRIREGIGGMVKMIDGKVVPVKVLGNIIQSYSPMIDFDRLAVNKTDLEWTEDWLYRPATVS